MNDLEFAGRLFVPELIVKDFNNWVVILKEGGTTLAHSVFILKNNKANFSNVSHEEMAEFTDVCKWFEEKTKNLFGAEKWNYCAMMMKESFVHFQAVPRYSKEINKYGMVWQDRDWPKRPNFDKQDIPFETLLEIKKDLSD